LVGATGIELSFCEYFIHLTIALLSTKANIDLFEENQFPHAEVIEAAINIY
jgi:hypothetical protein